jgi:hypothetical protein
MCITPGNAVIGNGVESWYDRYVRIANKAQFVRMRTKSCGGELLTLSSALFQYWQLRKSD